MKPGIYYGKTNEAYHAGPGYSSTQLKKAVNVSPHAALDAPRVKKKCFDLGDYVHKAILEPELWANMSEAPPSHANWNYRHERAAKALVKGASKAKIAELCNAGEDKVDAYLEEAAKLVEFYKRNDPDVERPSELDVIKVERMRELVLNHPAVGPDWFGEGSTREASIYWMEPTTVGDVLCKCRIDSFREVVGGVHVIDVKHTGRENGASPENAAKAIQNLGYHTSLAFYGRGIEKCEEIAGEVVRYTLVFVESYEGGDVAVYDLRPDSEAMARGRMLWRMGLELLAEAERSPNVYRGYSEEALAIDLPPWGERADGKKLARAEKRLSEMRRALPAALRAI